jgi:hypothetical protein
MYLKTTRPIFKLYIFDTTMINSVADFLLGLKDKEQEAKKLQKKGS